MPVDVILTFADGTRIRHVINEATDFTNAAMMLDNQPSFVDPAKPDKIYFRTGLVAVEKVPTTTSEDASTG